MREPPRYETAERLGLAPRSGFVQPFLQADLPTAGRLSQTLGVTTPCLFVATHVRIAGEAYQEL